MSGKPKHEAAKDKVAFYMDLLGHDILNNNQAVMSYLELIMASPGADKKVVGLAEKAVSHVRTTTVLVDNVKRLMATRGVDPEKLKPVDIVQAVDAAERELKRHFPSKRVRLVRKAMPARAMALGNNYASDLIFNALITAVRLDQSDDVILNIGLSEKKHAGKSAWSMTIEDEAALLPPFLDGKGIAAAYSQDVSTAVRTTGVLFAKMIAENIGGDFEAHSIHHDPKKKGAIFTVVLRKAEKP